MRFALLAMTAASLALVLANVGLSRLAVDTSPILDDARSPKPAGIGASSAEAPQAAAARDLSELIARPLFSPDRRRYAPAPPPPPPPAEPPPVVVEVAPPPPVAAPPPDLQLLGVSLSAGVPSALLAGGGGSAPMWLREGASIEGWTLVDVASGGASLESGGQRIELALYPKSGTAVSAPQ